MLKLCAAAESKATLHHTSHLMKTGSHDRSPSCPAETETPSVAPLGLGSEGGGVAVTVDLEEWFHVCGHETYSNPKEWNGLASNVERASAQLFSVLEARHCLATVFVLGWVAKKLPGLIRELARRGHEIASHSMSHRRMDELSTGEQRAEIRDSKKLLEDLSGFSVLGFRAPEWSVRSPSDSSLRLLAEEGYLYDASMSAIPGLGNRNNPSMASLLTWTDGKVLAEFPPLTGRVLGYRLPAGGSWVGRLFPASFVANALAEAREAATPAVVTVHPWEFDVSHPADRFPPSLRLMHHAGLARAEGRLLDLIDSDAARPRPLRDFVSGEVRFRVASLSA